MRKKTHWFPFFLLVSALLVLSACASSPASPEDGIEITDTSGYTVKLEKPPERIVIAGRALFMVQDAVYLFPEAVQRVVALERINQSDHDFLPVISDQISETETLEINAGPEQIVALNPDLVIMKGYMASKSNRPLEALGIPSIYLNLETPEMFYQDIRILGQVFQNPDRAEEINAFYQDRVAQVNEAVSSIPEDQKSDVLILRYSDRGGETAFFLPPSNWIQTRLAEEAGGKPVWVSGEAESGWQVVSFEQVAAWNPDQIYLIDYGSEASQVVERLKADSLWRELQAVQDDQLYAFPSDFYSWDQPDTRWILGLQWLATKIHPEQTAQLDIMGEARSFYTMLYGLDDAAFEAEVLPLLRGNLP
jgi:iron complex transport system substrate-binding protein